LIHIRTFTTIPEDDVACTMNRHLVPLLFLTLTTFTNAEQLTCGRGEFYSNTLCHEKITYVGKLFNGLSIGNEGLSICVRPLVAIPKVDCAWHNDNAACRKILQDWYSLQCASVGYKTISCSISQIWGTNDVAYGGSCEGHIYPQDGTYGTTLQKGIAFYNNGATLGSANHAGRTHGYPLCTDPDGTGGNVKPACYPCPPGK